MPYTFPHKSRSYIKTSLGGPTPSEYESVVAERDNLQKRVAQLEEELAALKATPAEATVSSVCMKRSCFALKRRRQR